ncbi:MAG TPA: mechanosensitive ion channel family protein [Salinimicrobium sp.]|nr:mechanosensitive ion channel family protein [Salinimicrobium sp.]
MNSIKSYTFLFIFLFLLLGFGPVSAQVVPESHEDATEPEVPEFAEDSLGRRNPRGTIIGFFNAVEDQNYIRASNFLNLSDVGKNDVEGERIVQSLQRLLDSDGNILPYPAISDELTGKTDDDLPPGIDRVGTVKIDDENIELFLEETKGPEGEPIWLFSAETVKSIAAIKAEEVLLIEQILPEFLENTYWGGVSVGQWLFLLILIAISYWVSWGLIWILLFLIPKMWKKSRTEPTKGIVTAFALPIRIYLAVWLYVLFSQELGISIIVRQSLSGITIIIGFVAILILLWRLTDFLGDFSRRRMVLKGNASGVSIVLFLKRAAKIAIVIFGIIAILGIIGVDVTTGLAALGIGGLALALGAQKTIENFVGSVTLITDQPVRVGDFCKVGDTTGTVERIGMRSTKIRTNERTIVTIPNGQFSSEKIENFAHRDRFLFSIKMGLRYETSPDQLRYVLIEVRSLLYGHPKVSPDPARIRFTEYGSSSLNLEIFSYISTLSFDEYLEVKEDLLLRIMDIIVAAGTDFAFPSQTLYFAKDTGISKEKAEAAEERVKNWREHNEMPIPRFEPEHIQKLKDSVEYPPKGSTQRKDEPNS